MAAAIALLLVVNGAPIIARELLGDRRAAPLDGGLRFRDGRPLLGASKTVRGVVAALIAGAAAATALGEGPALGVTFAALAMTGDALSSFIKRRLGIAPSGMALGLDQIPEAALPAAFLRGPLGLAWSEVALVVLAFTVLELVLSPLLYRLQVRKRPY